MQEAVDGKLLLQILKQAKVLLLPVYANDVLAVKQEQNQSQLQPAPGTITQTMDWVI